MMFALYAALKRRSSTSLHASFFSVNETAL
jgi:hypothetical protein